MVRAENEAKSFTQAHHKAWLPRASELAWPTSDEVLDARGGAQVGQPSAEFFSHRHTQVAVRFGLALTELPQRFRGEGEFQLGHNIGFSFERQTICAQVGTRLRHEIAAAALDRKSTRLNSSHITISYAVFC